MSEFVIDDWKLKARTVVKLYRKNANVLVSQSKKAITSPDRTGSKVGKTAQFELPQKPMKLDKTE